MELLISIVVGAVLVELYAWLPNLTNWMLERSVRQLRTEDQERCREEWKASLDAMPNTIVRLIQATSFIVAAYRINEDSRIAETGERLRKVEIRIKDGYDKYELSKRKMDELRVALVDRDSSNASVNNSMENFDLSLDSLKALGDQALGIEQANLKIKLETLCTSSKEFSKSIRKLVDRAHSLLSARIKKLMSDFENFDSTCEKYYRDIELVRRRKSSGEATIVALEKLADEFEKAMLPFEQDDTVDAPAAHEEYDRIMAQLTALFAKMPKH